MPSRNGKTGHFLHLWCGFPFLLTSACFGAAFLTYGCSSQADVSLLSLRLNSKLAEAPCKRRCASLEVCSFHGLLSFCLIFMVKGKEEQSKPRGTKRLRPALILLGNWCRAVTWWWRICYGRSTLLRSLSLGGTHDLYSCSSYQ